MSMQSLSPPPTPVNPSMRQAPPLTADSITAARTQQAEDQIVAVANIVTAILAARSGEPPRRIMDLQPDEAAPLLAHARRALAERDPAKVGVALYRGHQALCAAVEELCFAGVRRLTSGERLAYRLAFHRAFAAYQAALEGRAS